MSHLAPASHTIPHAIPTLGRSIPSEGHVTARGACVAVGTASIANTLKRSNATPNMTSNVVSRHMIGLGLTTILVTATSSSMIGSIRIRPGRLAIGVIGVTATRTRLCNTTQNKNHQSRKNNLHNNHPPCLGDARHEASPFLIIHPVPGIERGKDRTLPYPFLRFKKPSPKGQTCLSLDTNL